MKRIIVMPLNEVEHNPVAGTRFEVFVVDRDAPRVRSIFEVAAEEFADITSQDVGDQEMEEDTQAIIAKKDKALDNCIFAMETVLMLSDINRSAKDEIAKILQLSKDARETS